MKSLIYFPLFREALTKSVRPGACRTCLQYACYVYYAYTRCFSCFFWVLLASRSGGSAGRAGAQGSGEARKLRCQEQLLGAAAKYGFSLSKKGRGEPSRAPRRSRIWELQTKPGTFRPDARRAPRAGNVTHPGAPSLGGRRARHRCKPLEHGCLLLKAPSELSQKVSLVQGIPGGQPCAGGPETFTTFPSWLKSNEPEHSLQGLGGTPSPSNHITLDKQPLYGGLLLLYP